MGHILPTENGILQGPPNTSWHKNDRTAILDHTKSPSSPVPWVSVGERWQRALGEGSARATICQQSTQSRVGSWVQSPGDGGKWVGTFTPANEDFIPTHILRSAPCPRKQRNQWDVDQAATGNMAGAEQAQVETQPLPPEWRQVELALHRKCRDNQD